MPLLKIKIYNDGGIAGEVVVLWKAERATFHHWIRPSLSGTGYPGNSRGWYQDTSSEQAHNEFEHMLSAADAQRERFRSQTVEGEEEQTCLRR